MQTRRKLVFLVKLLVSGTLLILLVNLIGTSEIRDATRGARWHFLPLAFAAILADVAVRAHSWRLLLRAQQANLPLARVLYSYMVGGFFGALVPTSLGSDLARTVALSRQNTVPAGISLASVAVLNFVSLLALCLLAVAALLLVGLLPLGLAVAAAALALGLLVLAVALSVVVGSQRWQAVTDRLPSGRLGRRLSELLQALQIYGKQRATLARVLVWAILSQVFGILTYYLVALALGVSVSLEYFFLLVPVITLARMLPVSYAGLGGEQGIFVLLFQQVGVPAAVAFSLSLIVSCLTILFLALCGLTYAVGTVRRARALRAAPVVPATDHTMQPS